MKLGFLLLALGTMAAGCVGGPGAQAPPGEFIVVRVGGFG